MLRHNRAEQLDPEPPLREGQFLSSPGLNCGQALRAMVVFVIAGSTILLASLSPANATEHAATSSSIAIANNPGIDVRKFAQLDLTKMRRKPQKKKFRNVASPPSAAPVRTDR